MEIKMAIKYFTNRPWRGRTPLVDRIGKAPRLSHKGSKDTTSSGVSDTLSYHTDWEVDQISFDFDTATSSDFSVGIQNGRKVIANANDYLWFALNNTHPRKITLDEGFYTGTELAAELESKLDTAFTPEGVTFTVDYGTTTANVYTIVPSAGTIRYDDNASSLQHRSIAGHLFGFEADSSLSASLASDTTVPALDKLTYIVNQTGSSVTSFLDDDVHRLDIDQAIVIATSTTALVVDYEILYRETY
jgi:hypothetical protein